jgi:cytochrome c553
MKTGIAILVFSAAGAVALAASAYAAELPVWAYPVNPPGGAPAKDDGSLHHVPGSTVAMTLPQVQGREGAPDWHPADHPQMPDIVANGRKPDVRACAYCHQPSGVGRPENASVAGLSPGYIKEQVAAFKDGSRKGSEPKRAPENLMITIAKNVTESDIEAAAAYFSALKPVNFVTVVESDTAPKTIVTGGMLAKAPEGGMEPTGNRIVEVPEDLERTENRDSRAPFIAYVPMGSVAKGAALVATGGDGKTLACGICHGADLKGIGDVPRISGRSPSYVVRQLYDIQNGTRSGAGTALMKQVVAKLDQNDMVSLAAYLATREP